MADNKLVRFFSGTAAEYAALATKDQNALYFIIDEKKIYKGDTPFGGSDILIVENLPVTGDTGVLYIKSVDGEVLYYNGVEYLTLVKPSPETMAATPDADTLATQKAVVDYVTKEIAKVDASGIGASITAVENRVTALETGKADTATTLAGYGITDAYTKNEANSAIATAVAGASHLKREIVDTLPTGEDIDENTIYMIAKSDSSENQAYDEYMFVNGTLEKIGDSEVSLTGYATEEYVNNEIHDVYDAIDAAKAEAVDDAKDYTDGLASNYATAAQGALADTALQVENIAEGATNGTIAVGDGEVAVHGLGSAAYTDTTAYEIAGAAAVSEAAAKQYTDSEIIKALTWNEIGA